MRAYVKGSTKYGEAERDFQTKTGEVFYQMTFPDGTTGTYHEKDIVIVKDIDWEAYRMELFKSLLQGLVIASSGYVTLSDIRQTIFLTNEAIGELKKPSLL